MIKKPIVTPSVTNVEAERPKLPPDYLVLDSVPVPAKRDPRDAEGINIPNEIQQVNFIVENRQYTGVYIGKNTFKSNRGDFYTARLWKYIDGQNYRDLGRK